MEDGLENYFSGCHLFRNDLGYLGGGYLSQDPGWIGSCCNSILFLLKKYEKERKAANVAMMAIHDGIQKAYSFDLGPLNVLRAAAFHGAQYIVPLKKNILSYAMGEQKWPLFLW